MSDTLVCRSCEQPIRTLCEHLPGCPLLVELFATQDTEPLSPDAARIVELERRVRELERFVIKQRAVMTPALDLGRVWLLERTDDHHLKLALIERLVAAVERFDALQPKG